MLDLGHLPDRDTFFSLVRSADFVLESAPPGELAGVDIDFETLRELNPRIVHVQITPYGSDGPAAQRVASDLTISAMGGQAALQGAPDRPPMRISVPQVWRHTGTEAAVDASWLEEHNYAVLQNIVGMTEEEMAAGIVQ